MSALELRDRERSGGRTEWIVGRRPFFISHHADGDELWLSHRPYGVNERVRKFPAGCVLVIEDIDAAIEEAGL